MTRHCTLCWCDEHPHLRGSSRMILQARMPHLVENCMLYDCSCPSVRRMRLQEACKAVWRHAALPLLVVPASPLSSLPLFSAPRIMFTHSDINEPSAEDAYVRCPPSVLGSVKANLAGLPDGRVRDTLRTERHFERNRVRAMVLVKFM